MRKKLYTSVVASLLVIGMPMSAMAYGPGDGYRHGDNDGWHRKDDRRDHRQNWRACKPQEWRTEIENNTELDLDNYNPQYSMSGNASVLYNTTGGAARSGNAVNDSLFEIDATIDNSGSTAAAMMGGSAGGSSSIENTGPNSRNEVQGTGGNSSIENTGPRSVNLICNTTSQRTTIDNWTDVDVDNNNQQNATSGNAMVRGNTTGGGATTGTARNVGTLDVSANVSTYKPSTKTSTYRPTSTSKSSIEQTGPRSVNVIQNGSSGYTKVENTTKVDVDNHNQQTALSGSATVRGNTTGGSATSGDATNVSTTKVSLKVSN